MRMTPKIWINGKLFDKADAKVSVYDHGLLYGDGIFEGIRCYGGKVFKLREHLDRLYEGARAIKLEIPITKEQFAEAIHQTIEAKGMKDCDLRPIGTRGVGHIGLDPALCAKPHASLL